MVRGQRALHAAVCVPRVDFLKSRKSKDSHLRAEVRGNLNQNEKILLQAFVFLLSLFSMFYYLLLAEFFF